MYLMLSLTPHLPQVPGTSCRVRRCAQVDKYNASVGNKGLQQLFVPLAKLKNQHRRLSIPLLHKKDTQHTNYKPQPYYVRGTLKSPITCTLSQVPNEQVLRHFSVPQLELGSCTYSLCIGVLDEPNPRASES